MPLPAPVDALRDDLRSVRGQLLKEVEGLVHFEQRRGVKAAPGFPPA